MTTAYPQLFAEGWVEGRHGSGTYVAQGAAGGREMLARPSPPGAPGHGGPSAPGQAYLSALGQAARKLRIGATRRPATRGRR